MMDATQSRRTRRAAPPTRRRMNLTVDSLKGPMAVLGVMLIIGAFGYFLIFRSFDIPMRILLAAGILLVGVAVAIDPDAVWSRLTTRNALYGGNTLAIAAIFLGILALINVLGSRRHERWDLTANRQFSLSDETTTVLQQVEQPIHAIGFYSSGPQDAARRQEFQDQFNEYQTRSGGLVTSELIDPVEQPTLAQRFAIREFGTVVLAMGDRTQQVTNAREADITAAILRLVRPIPKKAYFTVGHNEHRLDGADRDGYSELKRQMEARNFTVEPLNLFAAGSVPEDADLVVVGGPKQPLTADEVAALGAYLDGGGKILAMVDPMTESGLAALTSRWNVEIGGNYVLETDRNSVWQSPFNPLVNRFPVHEITKQMPFVVFPSTTYLVAPRETPPRTVITSLAQTSDRSWGETTDPTTASDPQSIRYDEGVDATGPLALALAVEVTPESAPGAEPPADAAKARMVLMGTSRLVTNDVFQLPAGNPTFFLNATNWLAGEEELISIRPKTEDVRRLFLSDAQRNTLLVTTILFLPAVVLALGVVVWWGRR
jgi:ABC-type uncharacterized transport system involved in gliding motility auxiliary subunit